MSVITLTQGSTTYTFRLANWLEQDAARAYTRPLPLAQFESIIGEDEYRVPGSPDFLVWSADSWKGGEGETVWRESQPDIYHESFNVRPLAVGDGLVLGAEQQASLNDAGTPAIHNQAVRLGVSQGKLWSGYVATGHEWQPATENWDATGIATGHGAAQIISFADIGDTWIYTSAFSGSAKTIRRWKAGSNAEWFATGTFTYDPILIDFQGVLYALDGDDLWAITAANTRELRSDTYTGGAAADPFRRIGGEEVGALASGIYLADTNASWWRASKSDVGPLWIQRMDNGNAWIYEYNHFTDTTRTRAQLPDHILPYSLAFANGFTFTGFRFATSHTASGDAYIHYERGGQTGFAGPIRSQTGTTASKPVRIGGMIGSDLIIYFDGAVWAYDLSGGGISMVADCINTSSYAFDIVTWGKDIFLSGVTSGANTRSVERISLDSYTTQTEAFLSSGSLDFRTPGVDKALLSIIVETDPLPDGTSLQVAYAVDGGGYIVHATTRSAGASGSATFDYTGGASEDLWTSASHGLSVDDRITFNGTKTRYTPPHEYDPWFSYYVKTVPSANTFQLSATKGGAVIEGTLDTVAAWDWVLDVAASVRHTFTVSTSTTSVIGRTFEIRVMPTTTNTANTVTIRNVTAYAAPVAKRWFYDFLLDLGDTGTEAGVPQEAAQVIADLKSLETTGGVWSLSYPGEVREHDAAPTTEVVVKDVDTSPAEFQYGYIGRIRMAGVSTV